MKFLNHFDLALVGALAGVPVALDNFESYGIGAFATGSGGFLFAGPWVVHVAFTGTQDHDPFEDYPNGADLNGLGLGVGFNGNFAARINYTGTKDSETFESYPDGASANGLAGGSGWGGPFVARYQ